MRHSANLRRLSYVSLRLEWLEQHLTPLLDGLDADAEAFIIWAWQHRHKVLQLFWNHHTFERGKRAGSSPLELAEVLDQLFCQSVAAQAAWFFQVAKSVNLFQTAIEPSHRLTINQFSAIM